MARIVFTPNLQRHVSVSELRVRGATVGAVLEETFREYERLRGYVLDDQGAVRKHVVVFVNGEPIRDRLTLSDPIAEDAEIYVMQALSGGS